MIADTGNGLMINFSTYPDGIFKGITRVLFFTIIPVGIANYMPIWIITKFNFGLTIIVLSVTFFITFIAFFIFYKGLKIYCSSNLMIAKI
jgi:ABC-2 type transport system permease protein